MSLFSCSGEEIDLPIAPDVPGILIHSDTQTDHDVHRAIVGRMLQYRPRAVFHLGDLVEDGTEALQWDVFDSINSALTSAAPFYPVAGNHEQESALFYQRFDPPGTDRWYSVTLGGVHLTLLNSNLPLLPGSAQYLWAGSNLSNAAADSGIRFRLILLHHPLYTTGPDPEDEFGFRAGLLTLISICRVDAVFTGHVHAYERIQGPGFVHITTGGGGGALDYQAGSSSNSLVYLREHHFCRIVDRTNHLLVDAISTDNRLLDRVEIPLGN